VKYKKEVTIYMKYSSVVKYKKTGDNVHEVQLCVVKCKKDVTMYMKYSFVMKYEREVTMCMKYSCV
jgi:ribosomal protein L27